MFLLLRLLLVGAWVVSLPVPASSDMYLQNPRGSNNRLSERSATRQNNNRLFDSQNNARGGYNTGDKTDQPANGNAARQYAMKFFQSSAAPNGGKTYMTFEWTNQHGCGGNEANDPHKQNCEIVLQYMCQPATVQATDAAMRDGTNTGTPTYQPPNRYPETENQANSRLQRVDPSRGMQETIRAYDACYVRQRNQGLFVADQNLKNNRQGVSSAIHTRQNPNGQRSGYECPEERDYYPYWHPTAWKDIAILTDQVENCQSLRANSFNVQSRHECVPANGRRTVSMRSNNAAACETEGGQWVALSNYLEKTADNEAACNAKGYTWAVPHDAENVNTKECLVPLSQPDCQQAAWSRSNHLGDGRAGVMLNYTWALPTFPSGQEQRCVIRTRYNISTDDYPANITASSNGENSPVQDNPTVNIGASTALNLALNTDQVGRTFQDRTHILYMRPRPAGLPEGDIYNLNVRGKRGNIVQTFPAIEYDFSPTTLNVKETDMVHIQWTGSNTHNNGANAGDGQQGDDGNGRGGTDRNNLMEISSLNQNFVLPEHRMSMIREATVHWAAHGVSNRDWTDVALELASAGKFICAKKADCPQINNDQAADTGGALNDQLNNAPASYEGMLMSFKKGTHSFMCTRNNDFSNRSHKGQLVVT